MLASPSPCASDPSPTPTSCNHIERDAATVQMLAVKSAQQSRTRAVWLTRWKKYGPVACTRSVGSVLKR
jgi:hypothetical protein